MIFEKFKIKIVGNESVSKKDESEIFSKVLNILINKRETRDQVKQKLLEIKKNYNDRE